LALGLSFRVSRTTRPSFVKAAWCDRPEQLQLPLDRRLKGERVEGCVARSKLVLYGLAHLAGLEQALVGRARLVVLALGFEASATTGAVNKVWISSRALRPKYTPPSYGGQPLNPPIPCEVKP